MPPEELHPGIFVEEVPIGVKPIEGVPTSVGKSPTSIAETNGSVPKKRGFWFWTMIIVGTAMLTFFILDPNGRGTLDLKWRESVQLASGQSIQVKRHVRFKQHFMLGVRMTSGRLYQSASLDIVPRPADFIPWEAPVQPMFLDRDPQTGEWLVVGAVDGGVAFLEENGGPCPPHWAFRLRNGVWYVQPLPGFLLKRKPNLLMDIRLRDDAYFGQYFFQRLVVPRKAAEEGPKGKLPSGMSFVGEISRLTSYCYYEQGPRFRNDFLIGRSNNPLNLFKFPRLP